MKHNNMNWDDLVDANLKKSIPEIDVRYSVRFALEGAFQETMKGNVFDALVGLFESPSRKWALGGFASVAAIWAFFGLVLVKERSEFNGQYDDSIFMDEAANYVEDWTELL
ncbi:hypothetical protein MLD52_15910 [Puniceicoccaceae bacterium K14]|nr:hypothetical protein [Puniceicoccaceae bacterium K14]